MSDASLFREFRENLKVKNAEDISTSYRRITARLNNDFWGLDSDQSHSMKIGSWGRQTAIRGVSDLDMVFEITQAAFDRYKANSGNGPSVMLQEVRTSLLRSYPNSTIKADGQVVGVYLGHYRVEVLPALRDANGDYIHGDTNSGGTWKTTKPRPEIAAVNSLNDTTSGNLKHVAKMLRAWKNRNGVGIGGLLVDTFAHKFFTANTAYNTATYADYPKLFVDLFSYLGQLPEQDYWWAPGSNQRVKCKSKFQAKARKAAVKCQSAIDASSELAKSKLWRKVFGLQFPKVEAAKKAQEHASRVADNEQFIEDTYPLDIRYDIELDCGIRQQDVQLDLLRRFRKSGRRLPQGKGLKFFVPSCDVPEPYKLFWKVRNQGEEATRLENLRGEIEPDGGSAQKFEHTSFAGDHYVEVYAVKDGFTVARRRIAVPIE
jgi:hypothetical protein